MAFRDKVIYQIYPKSFRDSDGDGVGDLRGVLEKVPYLASLGIDMIWFNPFFPSPQRDNGQDISDYCAVDPSMGTMADFEELTEALAEHGIGVMLDMVLNHCSTGHAWFQRALAGDERYCAYFYLQPPGPDGSLPTDWESKFGGPAWAPFGDTGLYYLHLFDTTQADLNWHNPEVRAELAGIVNFWRSKGVHGFRFDVINLIGKDADLRSANDGSDGRRMYTDGPDVHTYLRELNANSFGADPDSVTVGEMSSTTIEACVGYSNPDNRELDMVFSFHHLKVDYVDGKKWTSMAFDFAELKRILDAWATGMQDGNGWNALFWNNHDQPRAIGVITGSMIPIIGLLAAAGILKGVLALLMNFDVITTESSTYMAINAMSDSVFSFMPIFVGFTAARRLGSDPIVVAIVGGVLTYPTLVEASGNEGSTSIFGMNLNADFFGVPYHLASYTYSIFPIIVAAWLAAKVEPILKRVIPVTIRMIFVPLVEVFVVSAAILLVLGPIVTFLSGGLAAAIRAVYDLNPTIAGLFIGGFYQSLVIFGLHWAVIPLVAADIASSGHSYLNAIISATMVAQGGAVLAIFVKSKVQKIKELAGSATLAAFSGITEPAMYGLNLKYGRAFITASVGGAVGGLLTGLFNVNMWGFTGSLIGFTSFINPVDGIDSSFYGFLMASAAALIVSFVGTYFFGFSDADLDGEREVKKVRLGKREPAGTA